MNKKQGREIKRQKGVMNVFLNGIVKKSKCMVDSKNNAHHPLYLLPDHCVPSGMCKRMGGGTVVIKDKFSQDLFVEGIEEDVRIIKEQVEFAIDEIVELKTYLQSCVDVYNDFSWEEVEKMSPSIQECWKVGCKFDEGEGV